jgi:H+/Cl- antiporter ClcA
MSRTTDGFGPIFPVELHPTLPWQELGLALPLGLVAGLGSGALTRLVYTAEDLFARLSLNPMWWPVIGGAVVGLGGLLYPHALGVGYDAVADLLSGRTAGVFLLGFLLTKAVIWAVALGSAMSGGVLAPLRIIGGSLGAAAAQWLRPEETGLWAMITVAAMMGGGVGRLLVVDPATRPVWSGTWGGRASPMLWVNCWARKRSGRRGGSRPGRACCGGRSAASPSSPFRLTQPRS